MITQVVLTLPEAVEAAVLATEAMPAAEAEALEAVLVELATREQTDLAAGV